MKKNDPLLDALFKEIELVNARFDEITAELQRVREDISGQRRDNNWGLLHIFRKLGIKVSRAEPIAISDELYEQAKQTVIEAGACSTSLLQRRLGVGYSRAARIVDLLEERGVVGAADGAKPRDLLIYRVDFLAAH